MWHTVHTRNRHAGYKVLQPVAPPIDAPYMEALEDQSGTSPWQYLAV